MEQLIPVFENGSGEIWLLIKWFYVLAFAVALVFSLVVRRQIELMARTLKSSFNSVIHLLGIGLVITAATGLVVALLVL